MFYHAKRNNSNKTTVKFISFSTYQHSSVASIPLIFKKNQNTLTFLVVLGGYCLSRGNSLIMQLIKCAHVQG